MLIAVFGTLFLISLLMVCPQPPVTLAQTDKKQQFGVAYAFGARFDVAIHELTQGRFSKPTDAGAAQSIIHKYDHGEL